ncbi:MAG: selenium-dependent molybdenum cofactor biosynthesis protein YqeB [bacterium]|nr:selenium-dependent molybdenum cofactor biosynthesis protein YqeB [bacterium]
MERDKQLVLVRGGGDIASGSIYKLRRAGYPVLVLETKNPSAIRRHVAFSEAVYDGVSEIEGMTCRLVSDLEEAYAVMRAKEVAMMVDETCEVLQELRPWAVVDAILAKRNLGTKRTMADKTIALGPGFEAGVDVDLVIETNRGHHLGRILEKGFAAPNTGIPGVIGGYGKERVLHAPVAGVLKNVRKIGDLVEKDEVLAWIERENQEAYPVVASISGLLRGLIRDGYPVTKGFKIADIDPRREEYRNCFTISDKARCIAGGVLEGLLYLEARQQG